MFIIFNEDNSIWAVRKSIIEKIELKEGSRKDDPNAKIFFYIYIYTKGHYMPECDHNCNIHCVYRTENKKEAIKKCGKILEEINNTNL